MNTQTGLSVKSISKLLQDAGTTVAVIGLSSSPWRTSNHIGEYLQKKGIRIIPVNPNETEVLGEKAYASLAEIQDDIKIDFINIFRNKKYTAEMVREVTLWSKKTGQKPVIWTQLDVSTDEAKSLADKNSLPYVENRCIMVEHTRL